MNATQLKSRPERLWDNYLEARAKAEETLNLQDGIAAARAYQAFLLEFDPKGAPHESR